MSEGTIIVLNGASSSGKTSIARALQRRLAEPYLLVGPDTLRPQLPERYFDPDTGYIVHDPPEGHPAREAYYMTTVTDGAARWYELHLGHVARRLIAGRQAAVAALAAAGNRLIVDEVLLDPEFLDTYLRVLRDFAVLFVGLRCPLAVLEQRERARGDRLLGHTRGHAHLVHAHGLYDLEVDTSVAGVEECAEQILRRLHEGPPPDAFARLRARTAARPA
jgi:chloramphenicol 3-O phosphotransferase